MERLILVFRKAKGTILKRLWRGSLNILIDRSSITKTSEGFKIQTWIISWRYDHLIRIEIQKGNQRNYGLW